MIELTALLATSLAAFGVVPQLWRLAGTGDAAGVSLVAATLGVATEAGWVFYTVQGGLWSAVPESVLMLITNVALAKALVRTGAPIGRSLRAAIAWLVLLAVVALAGGTLALGMMLPIGYAVQVAPAIWCAYRTWSPSGIAAATWILIGLESALWGAYGAAHDDPAIMMLAGVGMAAAASIILRKVTTRNRGRQRLEAGSTRVGPLHLGRRWLDVRTADRWAYQPRASAPSPEEGSQVSSPIASSRRRADRSGAGPAGSTLTVPLRSEPAA